MPQPLLILIIGIAAFFAIIPLYALPATLSLPRGRRPGLEPQTLDAAAEQLRSTGKTGADLVEAARALVAGRMAYCRRNSFDIAPAAFERGYGYCQQQAFALADLLNRLGIEAWPVQAMKNRFPNGVVGGHVWVRTRIDGHEHDIDSILYDTARRTIDFEPLSEITRMPPLFRIFAAWGSTAVNAHRWYVSGRDQ